MIIIWIISFYHINLDPPEVETTTPWVHTTLGLRSMFECKVVASPMAKIHWFHGQNPVQLGSRIFTMSKSDAHQLVFKNVRPGDLGSYTCKAENRIGMVEVRMQLSGEWIHHVLLYFRISIASILFRCCKYSHFQIGFVEESSDSNDIYFNMGSGQLLIDYWYFYIHFNLLIRINFNIFFVYRIQSMVQTLQA